MKVAFLIERNIYFRIFGPVIDKALEKGHEVFCLHNYSQPKTGSKAYQFPYISQAPQFTNGGVISLDFRSQGDFIEKCLQNNIQAIVSLNITQGNLGLIKELKLKGIYWVALQNGFDTVAVSGNYLTAPDKFFIYSPEWLECIFDYLKRAGFQQKFSDKIMPVGFWLAEQKTIINPQDIKKKWGIPENKKVVLLLPFPFGSSLKRPWTKYIYGTRFFSQENDYSVCLAIKEFCRKNSGYLLVKSRQKDPVRNYLKKMADKVLYDEEFYPSTIMECLAIADICFNFYSTVAIEAISMDVPNVCIAPKTKNWKDIQTSLWQTIFAKEKDFFDFPGVSYLKTISEIIKDLPQKSFSDFSLDKEKQNQYLQKFANNNIETASENIISEIEKLTQKS